MRKAFLRKTLAFLLALSLLYCAAPLALAEEDESSIRDWKGTAPVEGPWLDHRFDADGSLYVNPPVDVRIVRVGLDYDKHAVYSARFTCTGGEGFRIGYYDQDRNFVERTRTESGNLRVALSTQTDEGMAVFDDWNRHLYGCAEGESLALLPASGETRYGDWRYRGGFECRFSEEGLITVINCVDLEDYVKGVIPYEMSPGWPLEALKAQAVCARTYVVYNQNQYEEFGFDVTADTESQVYHGTLYANDHSDEAVNATRGKVIRYKGEVCRIYYSAADGGATEDGRYVFDADLPYLCGKRDPFEDAAVFDYRYWTERYFGWQITGMLRKGGYPIESVESVEPIYSAQNNVIAIRFTSVTGEQMRLDGRECYTILRLPSCRFTIERDGEGRFVFNGAGLGHNCGMSQWGARAMDEVYGYTYEDIIRFYFTGAYVA